MTIATDLPPELQQLLDQDSSQSVAEVRRLARCTQREAQELVRWLPDGLEVVVTHPNLVAQLVGDPQPRWLAHFRPQRSLLLRTLRRGNRLEAMRLLTADGTLTQPQARQFAQALVTQGEHWQLLEKLYANPPQDFWTRRPTPQAPPPPEFEMLFPPEQFDPDLLLEWLARGHYRTCVMWVRQVSGCPRDDCKGLVDRLDELVFDGNPIPWEIATRDWPQVVAALAGLPNPLWLDRLKPQREQLLELVETRKCLAAAQLVSQTLSCPSLEARRFLRRLGNGDNWDSTEKNIVLGRVFHKPASPPSQPAATAPPPVKLAVLAQAPKVEAKEELIQTAPVVVASEVLCGPDTDGDHLNLGVSQLRVMPWDTVRTQENAQTEKDRQAFEVQRTRELVAESKNLETARRQESAQTRSDTHLPTAGALSAAALVSAAVAPPMAKFSLNDSDQLLDRLTRLGKACSNKDMAEATKIYAELEGAGFNRGWVGGRYPALLPFLPEDPWSQRLPQVGHVADNLSKILSGQITPAQVAQNALKSSQLDGIVGALETAWKSKKKADLEKAVALLNQHPHLADEINQRVPWLADLMDMDKDGTSDVMAAVHDPVVFFSDLLLKRFPELQQRLGAERIESIKEALPELLQTMKERNMRGVMRVMSRLRLGPSDVKTLLSLLREMHR
ncbi:hypothetical protein IV102_20055 [bacterium]|nr:hypothetical protein [bacterium]